jgi:hypothetical protein
LRPQSFNLFGCDLKREVFRVNRGATVLAMAATKPASVRPHYMARPNYSGEKRRKELEKQKKKEEKKRRKLENASLPAKSEEVIEAREPAPEQPTENG